MLSILKLALGWLTGGTLDRILASVDLGQPLPTAPCLDIGNGYARNAIFVRKSLLSYSPRQSADCQNTRYRKLRQPVTLASVAGPVNQAVHLIFGARLPRETPRSKTSVVPFAAFMRGVVLRRWAWAVRNLAHNLLDEPLPTDPSIVNNGSSVDVPKIRPPWAFVPHMSDHVVPRFMIRCSPGHSRSVSPQPKIVAIT